MSPQLFRESARIYTIVRLRFLDQEVFFEMSEMMGECRLGGGQLREELEDSGYGIPDTGEHVRKCHCKLLGKLR